MKKPEIVIIHWVDAALHGTHSLDRKSAEECGLITGIACGVLVKENKEFITIAADYFPEEDSFRCVNTYPKSGIKQIIRKTLEQEHINNQKEG